VLYYPYVCALSFNVLSFLSCQPFIVEAWVQSWVSPCGICGLQNGTGTGFSPSTLVVSIIPSMPHIYPCIYHRCIVILANDFAVSDTLLSILLLLFIF